MRAADIETGDDVLSFFHASGFHRKGGRFAGRALRIIPVLDLKGGEVVRAERGRRDSYQADRDAALREVPTRSRSPKGCGTLYPFRPSISPISTPSRAGRRTMAAIARLGAMPDAPELWVDAGIADAQTLDARACPAVGSSGAGLQISEATTRCSGAFAIIPTSSSRSIFSATGFAARSLSLDQPDLWPQKVIVMTLAKVGRRRRSGFRAAGRDQAKAGNRSVIAAGGVRDEADIRALSSLGVAAALVATSLHNGTLTSRQLKVARRLRNVELDADPLRRMTFGAAVSEASTNAFSRRNRPSGSAEGFACAGLSRV